MVKRTLYFGDPAYLRTKTEQLIIEKQDDGELVSVPIEDIGLIILDHAQITITSGVIAKMLEKNVAIVTCDDKHHPTGLMLNLDGHTLQSKQFAAQIEASLPMKKQFWQQTITAKIYNQAQLLKQQGRPQQVLYSLSKGVKSGDSENAEAKAAACYWKFLFPANFYFRRDRFGLPPNNLLNYGYAILRAIVARNLVGSGLLPTLGIFHRNQYNAYCLADDIMEPYRPFVDRLVLNIIESDNDAVEINPLRKKQILQLPTIDVSIKNEKSPLMVAVQRTTASLARCYEGKEKKILYPEME